MTVKTKKILLIEDNPEDVFLIEKTLHDFMDMQAFEIVHFMTMLDGEQFLEDHGREVCVVLLDLNLPDTLNARDTFQRIKHHAHDIPVVILTGASDQTMALDLVRAGAEDFISKGAVQQNPAQLKTALDFAMCRHKISYDVRRQMKESEAQRDMLMSWMDGGYSISR